jgi:hypothetical protein
MIGAAHRKKKADPGVLTMPAGTGLAGAVDALGAGLVLSFLIGGVVLLVLSIVPWVGGLVTLIATLVGLGAAALVPGRRSPETASS